MGQEKERAPDAEPPIAGRSAEERTGNDRDGKPGRRREQHEQNIKNGSRLSY